MTENLEQLTNLSDKDIDQLWVNEALRRNAELDSGSASMRDAEDVFRDARSNLRNRQLHRNKINLL